MLLLIGPTSRPAEAEPRSMARAESLVSEEDEGYLSPLEHVLPDDDVPSHSFVQVRYPRTASGTRPCLRMSALSCRMDACIAALLHVFEDFLRAMSLSAKARQLLPHCMQSYEIEQHCQPTQMHGQLPARTCKYAKNLLDPGFSLVQMHVNKTKQPDTCCWILFQDS